MRIIEIYDSEKLIYNVMPQALYPEAEFVFVAAAGVMSNTARHRIKKFFELRGAEEPRFLEIEEITVDKVAEAIEPLLIGRDCFIDMRGGPELLHAALGAIAERYDLSMFQINPYTALIKLIRGKLPVPLPKAPDLKFKELISLTGGCVATPTKRLGKTTTKEEEYQVVERAVERLWIRYSKSSTSYNSQNNRFTKIINPLNEYFDLEGKHGELVSIRFPRIKQMSKKDFNWATKYIRQLKGEGVVDIEQLDSDGIVFRYKNFTCRELIEKSGTLVELFGFISAIRSNRFTDVLQSVELDWDGKLSYDGTALGTNNEVDLVLVDGFTIYYISCKSGRFDRVALYELDAVASKFDTGNIRKLVLCDKVAQSVRERANNMGIQILSNVSECDTFEDLARIFLKLS